MTNTPQTTVVELPAEMRDATSMRREINRNLMVGWINANLEARANLDVRASLVLYDDAGVFEMALPASIATLDNFAEILQALFDRTPVRFYSKGI